MIVGIRTGGAAASDKIRAIDSSSFTTSTRCVLANSYTTGEEQRTDLSREKVASLYIERNSSQAYIHARQMLLGLLLPTCQPQHPTLTSRASVTYASTTGCPDVDACIRAG